MRLKPLLMLLLLLPHTLWGSGLSDSLIGQLQNRAKQAPEMVAASCLQWLERTGISPKQRADLLLCLGTAQQENGAWDEALTYTQHAYQLFDSLEHVPGKIAALNNLGSIQLSLNNLQQAARYFNQVLADKRAGKSLQAFAMANLATVQEQQGDFEKAIQTHQKSIQLLEAAGERAKLPVAYHNLAVCYGMMGDYQKSETYELRALDAMNEAGDSDYLQALVRLTLGSLYLQTDRKSEASTQLQLGGKAAKKLQNPAFLANYYENMANLLEEEADFKAALGYRKQLDSLRFVQFESDKVAASAAAEKRFQADLAHRELALSEARAQKTEQFLWGSIMAGLLVLVLLVLLFRNYQLKRRSEKLLSIENQLLSQENTLARFETLRQQISPHFLFNALNTLQALIGSDTVAAQRFVRSFSRIFRRVLEAGQQPLTPLSAELEQVEAYLQLQELRFGGQLQLIDRIDEEMRSLWLPPFALQMLIENAIKHNQISEQQPLLIELSNEGRWLKVTNAIHKQPNPTESTGMGLQNIKARYQLLGNESPTFDNTGNFFIAKLPLLKP